MTSQRLVKCKLRKVRELFRLKKHNDLIFGEIFFFFSKANNNACMVAKNNTRDYTLAFDDLEYNGVYKCHTEPTSLQAGIARYLKALHIFHVVCKGCCYLNKNPNRHRPN